VLVATGINVRVRVRVKVRVRVRDWVKTADGDFTGIVIGDNVISHSTVERER
jgi:hypothetical protein